MKSIKISFMLVFVLLSCNKFTEPKPKKLLDRETMTNIFYDLALLESAQGFVPGVLSENKIKPKEFIFKKYQIDSLDFVQNNRYYASNVELYKRIYDDVHKKLTAEKENLHNIQAEEQKKQKEKLKPKR